MLAQQADAFIGLRVPEPVKKAWTEKAKQEHRSLSNWIQLQLSQLQLDSPTREDRRRGRKSAA